VGRFGVRLVQRSRVGAERAPGLAGRRSGSAKAGPTSPVVPARINGLSWLSALVLMRLLAGQLLIPLLATLLVLTTPVGTGQAVHENVLLHPVLPHVHLIDGRIVSDEQLAAARAAAPPDSVTSPQSGPALGAGSGADALGLGLALGPTLPLSGMSLPSVSQRRLPVSDSALPTEFRDPPQDPPPNLFA
jgi:hypothetical protein